MSLYVPPQFSTDQREDALALIRAHAFATLITTPAGGGEPHISHLPLLLESSEMLLGHMAKANPHWQAFIGGQTVAVFHGPHAYITPNWYVEPARQVPTWNYSVVHVHGQPQLIEPAAAKLSVVDVTTAAFEDPQHPWTRQVDGARLSAMLDQIVAFRIPLHAVEAKFKMNQNKTDADRAQVRAQLRASKHPDLHAMADWMELHERA